MNGSSQSGRMNGSAPGRGGGGGGGGGFNSNRGGSSNGNRNFANSNGNSAGRFGNKFGANKNNNASGARLRKPNWDMKTLRPFKKDFYIPHPKVANRSGYEIEQFRKAKQIAVEGREVSCILNH